MARRAERRRHGRQGGRIRHRLGTQGILSSRRRVAFGALIAAVVAVAVYLVWPGGGPALAFDKLQVDLGTVTRDQEGVQTFLIMNRGDGPLEVGPVDLVVEQGCDQAETVQDSLEVRSGEQVLLPVHLGPHRKLGPHRITVNVASNDPSRPSSTLSLRFDVTEEQQGSESGPRLNVDKKTIHIGDVPYDWPLYELFTLRNDGDAPLVLRGVPVVRVEEGC